MSKNYLFITGCPRSGTSALSLLMGAHPKIAMGVERFHNYVVPEFTLTEDFFEEDRFFDFQAEDSHINLEAQPRIKLNYERLKNRYNDCSYYGDKIPYLYKKYPELLTNFNKQGQLKILFIVRNILDVANSYNVRFEDQNLKWRRDVEKSVKDWNASLNRTMRLLDKFNALYMVEYEDLYGEHSHKTLQGIMDFLELDMAPELVGYYDKQIEKSKALEEKRSNNYTLNSFHKRYIIKHARTQLYGRLLDPDNT